MNRGRGGIRPKPRPVSTSPPPSLPPQFLLIFRKAAAGELEEDSGLHALACLSEINVSTEGVKGAKSFFEAKVRRGGHQQGGLKTWAGGRFTHTVQPGSRPGDFGSHSLGPPHRDIAVGKRGGRKRIRYDLSLK